MFSCDAADDQRASPSRARWLRLPFARTSFDRGAPRPRSLAPGLRRRHRRLPRRAWALRHGRRRRRPTPAGRSSFRTSCCSTASRTRCRAAFAFSSRATGSRRSRRRPSAARGRAGHRLRRPHADARPDRRALAHDLRRACRSRALSPPISATSFWPPAPRPSAR